MLLRAVRQFAKGRLVFRAGETADVLFFVHHGRVKISAISAQGKEAILVLSQAGDFIGEEAMTQINSSYITTATAITDCSLIPIEVSCPNRSLKLFVG